MILLEVQGEGIMTTLEIAKAALDRLLYSAKVQEERIEPYIKTISHIRNSLGCKTMAQRSGFTTYRGYKIKLYRQPRVHKFEATLHECVTVGTLDQIMRCIDAVVTAEECKERVRFYGRV